MASSIRQPVVPNGWRAVRLADVARIHAGGRLKLTKGDYRVTGVPAYSAAGQDGFVAVTESEEPAVILSSIGARCGKCFYAPGPWTTLANTQAIIPDRTQCDPRFLYEYVNDESYWFRSGSAQPFIAPSTIKSAWIALPPLDEQRRIAAVLSAIDGAVAAGGGVAASLTTLRQRLADDLFNDLAEQVAPTPLGQVATIQTGVAKNKASEGATHERPYLSVANVKDGHLDLSTVKTICVEDRATERFALRKGDVLFCEGGDADKVGRGTVWHDEIPGCLHQNHVFAVRTDPARLLPDFLSFYRSATAGRRYFLDAAKQTTNLASINSSQLRAMPIPVPSLSEQRRVVALIGGLDARLIAERRADDETKRVKRAVAATLLGGAA